MESWKFGCYVFLPIFSMSFFHSAYFYDKWIMPYRMRVEEADERKERELLRKYMEYQKRVDKEEALG